MAKTSGIQGVNHVAIYTRRVEQAEVLYVELFEATVLFRATTHQGHWVGIDADYGWDDARRRGISVEASFMRAGGLTLIVSEGTGGERGTINHVGIGCTEREYRRIKELVRAKGYRMPEQGDDGFKFVDELGVIWEITRGTDAAKPPAAMLDLRSGRLV